ncbi:MAG: PDZ domain-containing protein, partial [Acidobacteriota bacterium]
KSVRPESNRGVDVREGDRLLMLNGQRVRTIAALRELYEGLAEGDEVKMALRRDGQPFLVSFARGAAGEDGVFVNRRGNSTGVRVIRAGGDGGDVELLHEARVLLGEQDGEVRVLNRLLDEAELHEGDVVVALNGQSVGSLADFRRLYGTMQVGQALRFELRRDKETLEVHLDKAEVPAGMMIRRSADGRR